MEQVTATIRDGDTILVDRVATWIQVGESPSGLREWHGHLSLPEGVHLDAGGPFQLETSDGRSGQIIVTNVNISSDRPTQVTFTGTGPFG